MPYPLSAHAELAAHFLERDPTALRNVESTRIGVVNLDLAPSTSPSIPLRHGQVVAAPHARARAGQYAAIVQRGLSWNHLVTIRDETLRCKSCIVTVTGGPMPFKSKAQRTYLALHGPKVAREFATATPKGANLPDYVPGSKAKRIAKGLGSR